MADSRDDGLLVKSVETLLAEKAALAAKEKKLIADLNAALGKMGYRIVSTKAALQAGGLKKPGRPPGSGRGSATQAGG